MNFPKDLGVRGHSVDRAEAHDQFLRIDSSFLNAIGIVQFTLWDWRSEDVAALAELLPGTRITEANYDKEGALSLSFDTGVSLSVRPQDKYEAWDVIVRPGRQTFALPGGGTTSFEI